MIRNSILWVAIVVSLWSTDSFATDTTSILSPSGAVQFKLFNSGDQLSFTVLARGITIIEQSPLVMTLDSKPITSNTKSGKIEKYKIDESYPWLGAHSTAINRCNGAKISINNNSSSFTLNVRVFDDGVAFRFNIPQANGKASTVAHVPDEFTTFKLPKESYVWYHDMYMHYEGIHTKKKIDSVANGEWVAPPATFKLKQGLYASITEADLKSYGGFSLQADGKNGFTIRLPQHQPTSYPYKLRYTPEDTLRLMQPAAFFESIETPWRVIMIRDLNQLVNCDIGHNLCPPPNKKYFPDGIKTSWIRPGRAVWKYLYGGGDGTPEVMKKFTDGAAALGFEHNILEGFWTRWTDDQLRDLVNYSKQKNVGIWLWKHSKSLRSPDSSEIFFRKCHDLGITSAKIDFFDHEAMEEIDLYERLLRQAASY